MRRTLALLAIEPHGFRMATRWADEYKSIYRLFETNLGGGEAVRTGG